MRDNIQESPASFATSTVNSIRPTIASVQRWMSASLQRVVSKRTFSRHRLRTILPALAIVAGAIACGLWLDSTAAGLFACILLFFLASIGRSLQRIAALLVSQSFAAPAPNWRNSGKEEKNQQNIYISAKAMERLRPWVEDEGSLTEESAKAYCSVLLDTLAMLHPKLAGEAPADAKWS